MAPPGPRRRRQWTLPLLLGGLCLIGLIAVGGALWVVNGASVRQSAEISIRPGEGLSTIAHRLERDGVIRSARAFMILAYFSGDRPVKPGDYGVRAGTSGRGLLAQFIAGKVIVRLLMIPQGMPSVLVRDRLMANTLLSGDIAVPQEGSILPDSYAYSRGEPRSQLVARMQAAMRSALAEAWANRSPRTVVRTPEEAVILASIVEKETGVASERPLIAGVYSNRLRIGMPLQADPTVIYPVTHGRPLGRRILKSELRSDNPYNTYRHAGLPPGPITNPGLAAIRAVLNPLPTKALYFVARGDGGHSFAETLDAHNDNVRRWYAVRDQR